ncbi:hypothetical protein N0V90_001087 [Kalmusia sp. IMI 367209]|nr:hypothetical protein N0V90_001087 [Kalmusia sp. IMI 367209]
MTWLLNSTDANGQQGYPAPIGETLYLVQGDVDLTATHAVPEEASLILGTLVIHSYGAKLEAGCENLKVSPGGSAKAWGAAAAQLRPNDNGHPPVEEFTLQAKTGNRIETIILRHLDQISSANTPGALSLEWSPPQVQVHSSVSAEKQGFCTESPNTIDEAAKQEEETEEEDEDLDKTVVPSINKSQSMRSTPLTSMSRTEIVQETPTINRIDENIVLPSRICPPGLTKEASTATAVVYSTAPQEQSNTEPEGLADVEMEHENEVTNSVDELPARKSRHPKVQIIKSTKRPSPAIEEEASTPLARPTKRKKTDVDSDSDSTVVQTVRKTATKGKKRATGTQSEDAPSRSQRSTPHSTADLAPAEEGEYNGPKPRVAFSNSSIQPTSSFAKYLRKHGGSVVDSVDGDCNILCIKDGPILKTPKLLQAIALGLPIVTDKWLIDSSKASRFLLLDSYMPDTLKPVWNVPQNELFKGYTIYFTPSLKATYKDTFNGMEKLCKAVGARRVVSKKAGGKDITDVKSSIFLAAEEGDKDVAALLDSGHTCFTKDFLTNSILRGELDLESEEFKVQLKDAEPVKKKGRPRNG